MMNLEGVDLRRPRYRREAFQRFYSFQLKYRAHPGSVYSLLPAIAADRGLDEEGRAWLAFLNGQTQNPAMSLVLLDSAPTLADAERAVRHVERDFKQFDWDTDRRYFKARFRQSVDSYRSVVGRSQTALWAAGTFAETWRRVCRIYGIGRLSAWSYIEFARILGLHELDAPHLMLGDREGSRSHRNGLCIVGGLDHLDWHASNPRFDGKYDAPTLRVLARLGDELLDEARDRNDGHPDATRLTLESALCTYKSWHRPNRRYTNVYSDLTYTRLRKAEARFPHVDMSPLWAARREHLPDWARLEAMPTDPGAIPVKQNHYLETGRPVVIGREYPDMRSEFDDNVDAGVYGRRKS